MNAKLPTKPARVINGCMHTHFLKNENMGNMWWWQCGIFIRLKVRENAKKSIFFVLDSEKLSGRLQEMFMLFLFMGLTPSFFILHIREMHDPVLELSVRFFRGTSLDGSLS